MVKTECNLLRILPIHPVTHLRPIFQTLSIWVDGSDRAFPFVSIFQLQTLLRALYNLIYRHTKLCRFVRLYPAPSSFLPMVYRDPGDGNKIYRHNPIASFSNFDQDWITGIFLIPTHHRDLSTCDNRPWLK